MFLHTNLQGQYLKINLDIYIIPIMFRVPVLLFFSSIYSRGGASSRAVLRTRRKKKFFFMPACSAPQARRRACAVEPQYFLRGGRASSASPLININTLRVVNFGARPIPAAPPQPSIGKICFYLRP